MIDFIHSTVEHEIAATATAAVATFKTRSVVSVFYVVLILILKLSADFH